MPDIFQAELDGQSPLPSMVWSLLSSKTAIILESQSIIRAQRANGITANPPSIADTYQNPTGLDNPAPVINPSDHSTMAAPVAEGMGLAPAPTPALVINNSIHIQVAIKAPT